MLVNHCTAVDRRCCGEVDNYRIPPHQSAGLPRSIGGAKYLQANCGPVLPNASWTSCPGTWPVVQTVPHDQGVRWCRSMLPPVAPRAPGIIPCRHGHEKEWLPALQLFSRPGPSDPLKFVPRPGATSARRDQQSLRLRAPVREVYPERFFGVQRDALPRIFRPGCTDYLTASRQREGPVGAHLIAVDDMIYRFSGVLSS